MGGRAHSRWIRWLAALSLAAVGCAATPEPDPDVTAVGDCGDGVQDVAEGCDDGNQRAGDGCSDSCQVEAGWFCAGEPAACSDTCGNGVRDGAEECDGDDLGGETCESRGGRQVSGELGCTPQCTFDRLDCVVPSCGNGIVEEDEECDDGNNTDSDSCINCRAARCGDGRVHAGVEECDDQNALDGDSCTTTCRLCDATDDPDACLITVYRFYNVGLGDHMFKPVDPSPEPGYVLEGNTWQVYPTQVPGTVPLYQVFGRDDHMLTEIPTEGEQFGYSLERLIGYIGKDEAPDVGGDPPDILCRYFHSGAQDHFAFIETAIAGYNLEFCSWRVWNFEAPGG